MDILKEINKSKYLTLVLTNESEEKILKICKTVEENQRFKYIND